MHTGHRLAATVVALGAALSLPRGAQAQKITIDSIVGPVTKKLQERFFDVVKGTDTTHTEWLTPV